MHAPAPSPNSTQVLRSSQFTTRDNTSTPTTRTFLNNPALMYVLAVIMEYTYPEQAADKSKAAAFLAPRLACTKHAVEGIAMSPVKVATMIQSKSSAVKFAASKAFFAASVAISDAFIPSGAIRRSLMPVRS